MIINKPNKLLSSSNNLYLVYDGDVLVETFRNYFNALKFARKLDINNPNEVKIEWSKRC